MSERSIRAPMTLRRRFLLHNLLLTGGLLLAGAVSVWRLGVVRQQVELNHNVYAELRTVGDVAIEVGTVRGLLTAPKADAEPIQAHLANAIGGLDQFIKVAQGYGPAQGSEAVMREAYLPINTAAASARDRLDKVLTQVKGGALAGDPAPVREQVDAALADVDGVAAACIRFMSAHQDVASASVIRNAILIGLLSVAAVLAAVLLSIAHDRLVTGPLQRLRAGVRRVAAAQFAERLEPAEMAASPEFLDLANEFNRMAGELDAFYHKLEEQVRARSRELVRSERLASVGFLAAGVAHEINNPLNIISGHAELTARQLARGRLSLADGDAAEAAESLKVIQDEAFRCKEITEKLLSLARQGEQTRESLDLGGVARDVAAMTRGLKNYRDRRVTLCLDPAEPLEVEANATEMKQVLLNLTINALEAVPPMEGEVRIEGRRTPDWVELSVHDNGRGMTPDVLSHVFEPFFTARKARCDANGQPPQNRGTGLGLSITHAIVESHGGRISVESDGPGRGSRFTVQLPARASRDAQRSPPARAPLRVASNPGGTAATGCA
ncbi:MAG TPA: HAMP domain-containing sensor histidine kinase [Tepidisphaeraceae bacterium]